MTQRIRTPKLKRKKFYLSEVLGISSKYRYPYKAALYLIIAILILSILIVSMAIAERGKWALGGEWFVLLAMWIPTITKLVEWRR